LPSLDEVRQRQPREPQAARQIESTIRSRRKPLESRHGRKVGDPLPPKKRASIGSDADSERAVSDDARVNGMAVRRDHKLTARSLSASHETNFVVSMLTRIGSLRALANHAAFDFLSYLKPHSESYPPSSAESHSDTMGSRFRSLLLTEAAELFTPPVPQSGSSKIVFASNREGSMQIYVMNGDGSAVTRLTYSGSNDDYPRWSPNGTKILFQSDRDHPDTGYMDIYVMNSDGSGVTRLTSDANDDSMASWSGDGWKIVFQSMRNGVNYQVYSMNADGSNQVCLTNTSSSDGEPSWSSDGTKIAFASDRDHAGYDSVYVMNSNGTSQQRMTFSASTVDDTQPAWSRDGSKIAFVSTRDSTTETWQETDDDGNHITRARVHINKEIYVMNADGSGQTRLTSDLANDDAPSWSPDGSKILFRSDRERDCCDPSAQVWTMNSNGSAQSDVSNDGTGNYTASWANSSGNQIPVANAGGTYSGTIAQNVPFHATNSYDPDGTIVGYSWTFGDGGSGSGATPTHAYGSAGTYTVTLTVTDNLGAQGTASTTIDVSSSSSDQYAHNFLQSGLGRSPNDNESGYWTDIMRAAYSQGQTSMLLAMTEFGMTLFESAEYAGRNRTNHEYVFDLYETYLMRYPDQDGWDFWTSVCNSYGRGSVRNAFEESGEFHNIVATLQASGNASSAASSLASARVDPFNESGNQVQARDCEFGIPLVSLPGRAGLDLGLSVSYSSLVWTQSGPYVYFNPDNEGLSPGFTIGFPSVQWRSFDAQTARNVYLLTAGGHRTELRQLGTSNIYESFDSSYLQLTDYGSSLLLRTIDGTQISYGAFANGWQATSVEDRNGNVLTIDNYWWGEIHFITDTLGRVLTFNYDGSSNLNSITQSWSGQQQPHTWVTFGWSAKQLHPSFSSEVIGTYDGENIPVLTMVAFADGTYNKFGYNDYGQVSQLTRYASDSNPQTDNHPLNATVYEYASTAGDCPRMYEQRVSAENWTSTNGVPANVVTHFSDLGDGSHQMIAPDGTIYKESYGNGWQHGLVTSTQVISGTAVEKSTTTSYVQDNTSTDYQTNPRVIASDITDGTNHRHSTTGYDTFALPTGTSCSLPNDVYEYDANQTTILRRTHTDYNKNSAYLSARIVGLPQAKLLYEGMSSLMVKTTYVYDWGGEYLQGLSATPTQHDDSYSTDPALVRGNLVDVVRWDITDPDNSSKALESKIAYDINGSVLFTRDPLNHQTTMNYSDSFSDNNNSRNTFAYPTTTTDADNGSSVLQYNFEFGAKTRVQGPPPQNQPNGVVQALSYDDATRLLRVTTTNTGAYTHYYYGPNYVQTYSSVNTVATNYWESDLYTVKVFDGLGRVLEAANYHPGSTGGYSAVSSVYDAMGHLVKQSNPTETNGNWQPTGDDSAGWVYTQQTYDWKGRPVETRHLIDGTVKYASYEGCGCAGGDVMTLTDEIGRRQVIYSDALGRQWKTETLSGNGAYSTSINTFNARDQIILTHVVDDVTGIYQDTTMSYDGYGRLQTRHLPEQQIDANNGSSSDHTTWSYSPDDTVQTITDARGVSATFGYNGRHLVRSITYPTNLPPGVATTANAAFDYDPAGNRTSMTDGSGSTTYTYDSLSRMSSETRIFSGLSGSYALNYQYNLAGEVKKITDPTNATVNYNFDSIGRINAVTGENTLVENVSSYASSLSYRAWGSMRDMDHGNGTHTHLDFNGRLQPISMSLNNLMQSMTMSWTYDYFEDGRIHHTFDSADNHLDRAEEYDNLGRLKETYTGLEAHGLSPTTPYPDSPYRQSMQYDVWGNMTAKSGRFWRQPMADSFVYSNNRGPSWRWQYDAEANIVNGDAKLHSFDAANTETQFINWAIIVGGGQTGHDPAPAIEIAQTYNGEGQPTKHVETRRTEELIGDGPQTNITTTTTATYYLYSSVLGGAKITEIDNTGLKTVGYVYANGERLAKQTVTPSSSAVSWNHPNPGSSSWVETTTSRAAARQEMDPAGAEVGTSDPFQQYVAAPTYLNVKGTEPLYIEGGDPFDYSGGYEIDGLPVSNSEFARRTGDGSVGAGVFFNGHQIAFVDLTGRNTLSHITVTFDVFRSLTPTAHPDFWRYLGSFSVGFSLPGNSLYDHGRSGGNSPLRFLQSPRQPDPDKEGIRSNLEKALKDPDCENFIKDLLSKAASDNNPLVEGGDILKIFDKVRLTRGLGAGGGQAIGSFATGDPQIDFRPMGGRFRNLDNMKEYLLYVDSLVAIHELIHLAGLKIYDDRQLAIAASKMSNAPGLEDLPFPTGGTEAEINHWVFYYSNYFDTELRKRCKKGRVPYTGP